MIKSQLNSKYKDKSPDETVANIKRFFMSNSFDLFERSYKTTFGTWCSSVFLYKNGIFLLSTSGKGTSELFSLASGYAELYERFCSFYSYERNLFSPLSEIHDYSISELLKIPLLDRIIFYKNDASFWKKVDGLNHNSLYSRKFNNVLNNNYFYCDERYINLAMGSNGKAAGNSFIEAFNQGFSELVERECFKHFVIDDWITMSLIPHDKINNPLLKEIITNIENDNKKIYIIDCSYNTGMPVVMVVLVDFISNRFTIDFGCFPIFDIALERCFTEIGQNIGFFEEWNECEFQTSGRNESFSSKREGMRNSAVNYFKNDESILEKFVKSDINYNVFISDTDISNPDIFIYWKKFISNHSLDVYVADNSLDSNIFSISIICEYGRYFVKEKDFMSSEYHFELSRLMLQMRRMIEGDYDFNSFYLIFNKTKNCSQEDLIKSIDNYLLGDGPFKLYKTNLTPDYVHFLIIDFIRNRHINDFLGSGIFRKEINQLYDSLSVAEFNHISEKTICEECFYRPLWNMYHCMEVM